MIKSWHLYLFIWFIGLIVSSFDVVMLSIWLGLFCFFGVTFILHYEMNEEKFSKIINKWIEGRKGE